MKQALLQVARRHALAMAEGYAPPGARYDFFYRGQRTHTVYVAPEADRGVSGSPTPSRGSPRLAIIIDDLGNDPVAADAILALPFPLTVSVLPHQPYSSEIADKAALRGDQVLLHLPMQSEDPHVRQENIVLRLGMSQAQLESVLAGMLATVPHARGVNNHEGSRATADPGLMAELMPALRARGLFFIDSRTSPATVAFDVAERLGVRAAARKIFLDDNPSRGYIENQIEQAGRDSVRDGSAIAIGHPRAATIASLAEAVPRLQARGVRFVFASDMVH